MPKLVTVVGNRPQFVKLGNTARLLRQMGTDAPFESIVINTGQHYDAMLSDVFFSELQIEQPRYDLQLKSGHIIDQIGKMLPLLREIFEHERPDGVLVYGDTNSTVAGAIAAAHLGIPLIHVEGGERLYRRAQMPEEINRIVTDHLSDLLLCSSRKGERYARREGMSAERAKFVGDPMYDIFLLTGDMLAKKSAAVSADYGMEDGAFVLSTIHRAENTEDEEVALGILRALDDCDLPVLLPAHPRLRHRLAAWGWQPKRALRLVEPLGYFDFQSLLRRCALVVSDSGGVNREAFFAGKGCIIPLDSSAWVEPVESGFATTVGQDGSRLREALANFRPSGDLETQVRFEFGNGDAAARIIFEAAALMETGRSTGEGPWHQLGHYAGLPKPAGYADLSFDSFAARLSTLSAEGYYSWGGAPHERSVLLLHRLENGLGAAQELAAIESEHGFRGLFCLSLGNPDFNPLAPEMRANIAEIAAMGHEIGLVAAWEEDASELVRSADLIEAAFGQRPVFAIGACASVAEQAGMSLIEAGTSSACNELSGIGTSRPMSDGCLVLDLDPTLWSEIPSSPLELQLRSLDTQRERQLARIRATLFELRSAALRRRAAQADG